MVYRCVGQRASVPYLIKDAGIGIYSAEELCYYIRENIFMLDRDFFTDDLLSFMRKELILPELEDKLSHIIQYGGSFSDLVEELFNTVSFVSRSELGTIQRALSVSDKLGAYEKLRIKGDFLMKCGRPAAAVLSYRKAIDGMDEKKMPRETARIYHNIGVAFASLFLFDLSACNFEKAFSLCPDTEDYRIAFLAAKRLFLSDKDFKSYTDREAVAKAELDEVEALFGAGKKAVEKRKDERAYRSALKLLDKGDKEAFFKEAEKILIDWKNEYRGSSAKEIWDKKT
ncbi:MAG: hypothetical protein K5989_02105 [Lachnospiraceae bacterium]|nr:hypothetical protein [Lachnospiraceae bacterium]